MKIRRAICTVFVCTAIIGCVSGATGTVQVEGETSVDYSVETGSPWASGSFSMSVPGNSAVSADSSFPLAAGETVRINASYTPDANMDFGLVDPVGKFHYFTVTCGSIDKAIQVEENGNYTLKVRNNSAKTVKVSGFVRY